MENGLLIARIVTEIKSKRQEKSVELSGLLKEVEAFYGAF